MTTATAPQQRPDKPDDAELARRIGARDERAFETVMRAHNRMLYRLARSILKDDAEAEDAVQEAYFAAYRNIAGFRGGAKLSTWLARIVINESYARLRKQKRASVVVPLESANCCKLQPRAWRCSRIRFMSVSDYLWLSSEGKNLPHSRR